MIICKKNNFGADEIRFDDWQSERLCVLNGVFSFDPADEGYKSVPRLEIELPAGFKMNRSAVSTALLRSSFPLEHRGTVLRCWIENRVLCIEKLGCWDEYGMIEIAVCSAFVRRGFRGELERTETAPVAFGGVVAANKALMMLKDGYVALTAYFSKFPNASYSMGPFSVPIEGFPKNVEAVVPVSVTAGSYMQGQKGSALLLGKIQNGHLHFSFDRGANNQGSEGSFLCMFGVRGTYEPQKGTDGGFALDTADVSGIEDTVVDGFSFRAGGSAAALETHLTAMERCCPFPVSVGSVPESAPYSASAFVMGRAENGKVSFAQLCWSRYHKAFTFEILSDGEYKADQEFFGTQMFNSVNW